MNHPYIQSLLTSGLIRRVHTSRDLNNMSFTQFLFVHVPSNQFYLVSVRGTPIPYANRFWDSCKGLPAQGDKTALVCLLPSTKPSEWEVYQTQKNGSSVVRAEPLRAEGGMKMLTRHPVKTNHHTGDVNLN